MIIKLIKSLEKIKNGYENSAMVYWKNNIKLLKIFLKYNNYFKDVMLFIVILLNKMDYYKKITLRIKIKLSLL